MLSTFDDEDYVCRAMQFGAIGYLLKDTEPEELVQSIPGAGPGQERMARVSSAARRWRTEVRPNSVAGPAEAVRHRGHKARVTGTVRAQSVIHCQDMQAASSLARPFRREEKHCNGIPTTGDGQCDRVVQGLRPLLVDPGIQPGVNPP